MSVAPWYCDGCGRANGSVRYQCEQCRGFNTYDLCDQCIVKAKALHPNHSFKLVPQALIGTPVINTTLPYYYSWSTISYPQSVWSPYVPLRQPKVKISYEYQT
ncbi:unnamed protein product [Rotaria sordida]|uniref:RanBP2-type domain-containing protein n=1 Tax=Rotaria sordida TaxID=392033 RepID=A0A815DYX4_9BILA|nr:unnamed protein product [Rotaria sordida]CAF1305031.1 unnamed protein product [Rotaria sordida]CAF3684679.1 unnamed protein product [Rotaria sordida]CAF3976421.1 unnamed protein product [Rotaria sordida]